MFVKYKIFDRYLPKKIEALMNGYTIFYLIDHLYFEKQVSCDYFPTFLYLCLIWIWWWWVTFCTMHSNFSLFLFLLTVYYINRWNYVGVAFDQHWVLFCNKIEFLCEMLSLCSLSLEVQTESSYNLSHVNII